MISNSSPPRTAPLTTLNNSPFSRGARAVHQGQKKAKAYNISIVEPDSEPISGQSKDEGADGQSTRSIGETSPNGNCDSTALTPISKGILKRKREAEMEPEDGNGVTCSKKKVIFADPISATKLIESRKTNVKTVRKRRLRYEEQTEVATNDPQPEPKVQAVDKSSEPQVTVNVDTAVNSPDSENSDPVVDNSKQTKVDGKVRKIVKNGATSNNRDIPGISGKDTNCTNQMMKEPTINSVAVLDKIVEHTSNNASGELGKTNLDDTSAKDGTSDAVFSELESLLQAIESPCADKESSRRVDPLVMDEVKESKTTENPIKDSSTDSKSNQMDHIKAFIEESPLNSPEARADEIIEPSKENEVNSIPSPSNATEQEEKVPKEEKKETEETKMDVDEEVNQPSTVKPLLESWVNVKKSVDLFIQSYCTMLTNRMKSWLNVKGINTIGDFANLVESSSDHLTESPICPLNEEVH